LDANVRLTACVQPVPRHRSGRGWPVALERLVTRRIRAHLPRLDARARGHQRLDHRHRARLRPHRQPRRAVGAIQQQRRARAHNGRRSRSRAPVSGFRESTSASNSAS